MRKNNPAATVDILVFAIYRNQVDLLLIERKYPPYEGHWAFPGGFIEKDETFLQAAYRELEEETGINGLSISPVGIFDAIDRDPRGRTISMAFWGVVPGRKKIKAASDAKQAKWFCIEKLPPLAFDHQKILNATKAELKFIYQSTASLLKTTEALKVKQLKLFLEQVSR